MMKEPGQTVIVWAYEAYRSGYAEVQKDDEEDADDAKQGRVELVSTDVLVVFLAKVIIRGGICSGSCQVWSGL